MPSIRSLSRYATALFKKPEATMAVCTLVGAFAGAALGYLADGSAMSATGRLLTGISGGAVAGLLCSFFPMVGQGMVGMAEYQRDLRAYHIARERLEASRRNGPRV